MLIADCAVEVEGLGSRNTRVIACLFIPLRDEWPVASQDVVLPHRFLEQVLQLSDAEKLHKVMGVALVDRIPVREVVPLCVPCDTRLERALEGIPADVESSIVASLL